MHVGAAPGARPPAWQRLRRRLRELVVSDSSPGRLGAAVGLGVLFGCSPFFGLQFVLALAVALPMRLNKLAVAIGSQISTPPLTPILVFASANLGEWILHRRLLPLTLNEIRAMPARQLAKQFLAAWMVGGLVLGVVLGSMLGAAVAVAVRSYRRRQAVGTEL